MQDENKSYKQLCIERWQTIPSYVLTPDEDIIWKHFYLVRCKHKMCSVPAKHLVYDEVLKEILANGGTHSDYRKITSRAKKHHWSIAREQEEMTKAATSSTKYFPVIHLTTGAMVIGPYSSMHQAFIFRRRAAKQAMKQGTAKQVEIDWFKQGKHKDE